MRAFLPFLLCLLFFHGFCSIGHTQTDDSGSHSKWVIQTSIAHPLNNRFPSITAGALYQLSSFKYMRFELGWITDMAYDNMPDFSTLIGGQGRVSYRKYLEEDDTYFVTGFSELSLTYRFAQMDIPGDFYRSNFQIGERINYETQQHNVALVGYLGISVNLTRRIQLDIAPGLGFGMRRRQFEDLPEDLEFLSNGSFFFMYNRDKPRWMPYAHPALITHIGYKIY